MGLFAYFNLPDDFLGSFLKSQFTPLPNQSHDFSGQTIIVTGGNVGLGLEAARHFVQLGAAKVILGCRSEAKGEVARNDIEATTKRTGVVEVWNVDLSSYKSVQDFCLRAKGLERLDVVVENAGIAIPKYVEVGGCESTITVNVISTFLMALLMLPIVRESAKGFGTCPRIVIVSSEAHEQAKFREQDAKSIFAALNSPQNQEDRYNTSKLLELLVLRELASAMTASSKPPVTINALTPGFCHSQLMRHAVFPLNFLAWLGKAIIGRTTEMGSRTLVAAAAAGPETHGKYMVDCKVKEMGRWATSEKGLSTGKRVYGELMDILEGFQRDISQNI